MKVSQLFEYLASGELGNLNLAEDKINIKPDKAIVVLRNINRGLKDLHTRFMLKRAFIEVPVVPGVDQYVVEHDDIVEVLHVYVSGRKLLEHEYTKLSVNSFKLNIVLGITDTLRVEYKASHRTLTELDISLDTEIDLPSSYVNALIYFVASNLFTGAVNQLDGDINEGVAYRSKYQAEVQLLENQGVDVEILDNFNHFRRGGFV